MRKITKESSEAFVNFDQYRKSNTEVASLDTIARFYLHGNCIAEINRGKLPHRELTSVKINLCGWHTTTTRERINGILDALGYDFRIAQRKHEQVLVRKWIFILKLSDDSFDPELAKKVFLSNEFVSGTDLNAIADF
ncbi:MAG: hypothetical protein CML19_02600 [Pusillimonas sp.]|nr:hypothetical protein [Pusillimonas sp.]|tara:strand:+ start:585 stop:995 length:411 start_codon:yes stop_codon:yes gene_type:complete